MFARTKCLFAVLAAFVALSPAPTLAIEAPEALAIGGAINWVFDYEEGKRLSRESGKPMFVIFRCER